MTAKPRITVQTSEDGGSVQLFLNETGLSLLVNELQRLSQKNDHFHLSAPEWGDPDGTLSLKPYFPNERTAGHLKVLFRPDEWDRKYYPQLFEQGDAR